MAVAVQLTDLDSGCEYFTDSDGDGGTEFDTCV